MRRAILFCGLLALVLATPAVCADGKVRVSVVAIVATESDDKIDPKLECIAREVRKMYPKFTGFQPAKLSCKSLPVGVADTFELIGDQTVEVTVQRKTDKTDRIQLKVAPPAMGEITYSTPCGKFLPIITPYRTKNNDLLIIAIRVQPCPGAAAQKRDNPK